MIGGPSNSADDYVQQQLRQSGVRYHIPLKALGEISLSNRFLSVILICSNGQKKYFQQQSIQYVTTSMNLHSPASRLYLPRDAEVVMDLNTFTSNVGSVYYDDTVLSGTLTTIPQLK